LHYVVVIAIPQLDRDLQDTKKNPGERLDTHSKRIKIWSNAHILHSKVICHLLNFKVAT